MKSRFFAFTLLFAAFSLSLSASSALTYTNVLPKNSLGASFGGDKNDASAMRDGVGVTVLGHLEKDVGVDAAAKIRKIYAKYLDAFFLRSNEDQTLHDFVLANGSEKDVAAIERLANILQAVQENSNSVLDGLVPIAEYRIDSCAWNGTSGEVIDAMGNFNGTAYSMTTAQGLICRGGDFTANGTSDYVDLPVGVMDDLTQFSISVWIKSSLSTYGFISGAYSGSGNDNEVLFWIHNGTNFAPHIHGIVYRYVNIPSVSDNIWHHIVWTQNTAESCVYVDGVLSGCESDTPIQNPLNIEGLILGQDQDSVKGSFDGSQDFEGIADELKFFGVVLTPEQIRKIYENESSGKNWDGSARSCGICSE